MFLQALHESVLTLPGLVGLLTEEEKATPLRGLKTRVFFYYESTIIDDFCPGHDDLWIHAFSPNLRVDSNHQTVADQGQEFFFFDTRTMPTTPP